MRYSGTFVWIQTKKAENVYHVNEYDNAYVYTAKVVATVYDDNIDLAYNYEGEGFTITCKHVTSNIYEGVVKSGREERGKAVLHIFKHENRILSRVDWHEDKGMLDSYLELESENP